SGRHRPRGTLDETDDLIRCSNSTAQRAHPVLHQLHAERTVAIRSEVLVLAEAELTATFFELFGDVRLARLVVAEYVIVRQRVPEEIGAFEPTLDRDVLVLGAQHRQHDRKVWVDSEADRHAALGFDD